MSKLTTVLKCRAGDQVMVKNYRSRHETLERAYVTAVETHWGSCRQDVRPKNYYSVTLIRRSASNNPITLTVGDDGIVFVVARQRRARTGGSH
jgi:hypothetical protein